MEEDLTLYHTSGLRKYIKVLWYAENGKKWRSFGVGVAVVLLFDIASIKLGIQQLIFTSSLVMDGLFYNIMLFSFGRIIRSISNEATEVEVLPSLSFKESGNNAAIDTEEDADPWFLPDKGSLCVVVAWFTEATFPVPFPVGLINRKRITNRQCCYYLRA